MLSEIDWLKKRAQELCEFMLTEFSSDEFNKDIYNKVLITSTQLDYILEILDERLRDD